LNELQHVGIPVTNLDRSLAFYARLGFKEIMRTELPGVTEAIRVAMIQLEQLTLELYQLEREEREAISKRTDGHVDHLALDVTDIEKAYIEICKAGLEVQENPAPVFCPFGFTGSNISAFAGRMGRRSSSIRYYETSAKITLSARPGFVIRARGAQQPVWAFSCDRSPSTAAPNSACA
jgi:lactoylglutathione lyase